MDYEILDWPVRQLIDLVGSGSVNLRPSYQRNDIWTHAAKKRLLQTMRLGFPLPAFFLHETTKDKYDMVDGQQRTRTIMGYLGEVLKDERGKYYSAENDQEINDYRLAVVVIRNLPADGSVSIRDFYYRVNKYGTKLNRPEIHKAQYANTPLQGLIESIAASESWAELKLFTQDAQDRMADLDFIAELLALQKFGITDKKLQVDKFYEDSTFTEVDAEAMKVEFDELLEKVKTLNEQTPLAKTRYKQRNDFYTLFNFIKSTPHLSEKDLLAMYAVLTGIGPSISPSNESCFPLQDYAINCVSQSHTKKARVARQQFFEAVLLNEARIAMDGDGRRDDRNRVLADVLSYFNLSNSDLIPLNKYFIIDSSKLPQVQ